MKFDYVYRPPNEEQENLLKQRGVIGSVFSYPSFSYKQYVQPVSKQYGQKAENTKQIKSATQLKYLRETIKNPLSSSYTYIISSDFNAEKARAAALHIFLNAVRNQIDTRSPNIRMPVWHYVIGGFKDRLRDDDNYKQKVGTPALLVIDGLASNSTEPKLEKARDLVELYSSVPRIVITCGTNPLEFAHERIFLSVNRVLYFGVSRQVQI